MTSPVSRDRLDAILRHAVWGLDMPLSYEAWEELKAAAAYALDADDRIAALEAERDALAQRVTAVRALHEYVPPIHGHYDKTGWCRRCHVDWPCPDAAALDGVTVPDDPRIAEVRALCEANALTAGHRVFVRDVLAILDRERR